MILPKIHKVHRPHPGFTFLAFMGFLFPIQADGSHTQAASSMSTVLTHPRGFPHMPDPFPHTFPRIPHIAAKLQKIRLQIQRDQRHDPANRAPTNPHVFSAAKGEWLWQCAWRGTTWHGHGHGSVTTLAHRHGHSQGHQPTETSVRFTQAYASNRFTQIPCANDGEAGAGTWRRLATQRRRRCRRQGIPVLGYSPAWRQDKQPASGGLIAEPEGSTDSRA